MLNIQEEIIAEGATVLKLIGDVDISSAKELRQTLLEKLQATDRLVIDCTRTSSLDFFIIQLLCSAHRSAINLKKDLSLRGGEQPEIKELIRATGFTRQGGCSLDSEDIGCLWC
jgi:anti-anti-sigma factor